MPQRTLHLTSPHTRGSDVKQLQQAIDAHGGTVAVDGEYGPETQQAEIACARLLGVDNPTVHRTRAQEVILSPSARTPVETDRAKRVHEADAKREKTGAAGMVHLALTLAAHKPPITENPAGSNTDKGGIIDQAQREVGISASFYCGAGVHYLAKHGGGLELTPDVRYCPSAEAHAHAGTGGFKALLPIHQGKAGMAVTFDEGGIAGHIETIVEDVKPGDTTVHTVGWNTSPEGGSGSQSNGGGIFEHHQRPITGSFPVRYALAIRWPA